jgi:hypothetical protein
VLEPTAAINGLAPLKLVKGQSLVLQFDSKGLLVDAFSATGMGVAKAIAYSAVGGLFLFTETGIFRVGAAK